jgi:hypothetical protein
VTATALSRPDAAEYPAPFAAYVGLVPENNVLPVLESQVGEVVALLRGLREDEVLRHHAPYTWSIKDVVGHLTDTERVMGYRALRFARADATPLPGFDENDYARAAGFDATPLADLLAEFEALRRSHLYFFRRLDAAAWSRRGTANGNPVTVRALAYVIAGHTRHHLNILRKRLSTA